MLLSRIQIQNYKSIRDVTLEPRELALIVGANASGKSNLAECFDFISEVYRHGLEMAVARKGGYENIAHRKQKRAKAGIKIHVQVQFEPDTGYLPQPVVTALKGREVRVEHTFSFQAKSSSIRAEFEVESEILIVSISKDSGWINIMQVVRSGSDITYRVIDEDDTQNLFPGLKKEYKDFFRVIPNFHYLSSERNLVPSNDLIAVQNGRFIPLLREFLFGMGGTRVFQISPNKSREHGVPTSGPELDRTGSNLPAVIDLLQKKHPDIWARILQSMRRILPGLDEIEVCYTDSRTLGLRFHERVIGKPWTVGEVSDGTIQTLGLLVAIFDPRNTTLVIEEPENSVHPWIIRNLLDACSEAAHTKQIIITTHSPIVINHVPPERVCVMWRSDGESRLVRLTELDASFIKLWESGEIATFDFLDSGAIPQAIPPVIFNSQSPVEEKE